MPLGRVPNTKDIGLESIGVKLDEVGAIVVNANYQTSIPSIYALGDVTNRLTLTPVATSEGTVLVNKLYASKDAMVDYDLIPTAAEEFVTMRKPVR
jgi:glutathione reductase (NADPH)